MYDISENTSNPTEIITESPLNQSTGELQNINPSYQLMEGITYSCRLWDHFWKYKESWVIWLGTTRETFISRDNTFVKKGSFFQSLSPYLQGESV